MSLDRSTKTSGYPAIEEIIKYFGDVLGSGIL